MLNCFNCIYYLLWKGDHITLTYSRCDLTNGLWSNLNDSTPAKSREFLIRKPSVLKPSAIMLLMWYEKVNLLSNMSPKSRNIAGLVTDKLFTNFLKKNATINILFWNIWNTKDSLNQGLVGAKSNPQFYQ